MSDADGTQLFWGIVKVDLLDPARDRAEFNEWYDTLHVPEFVEQPGFRHGWRTETIDHPSALGPRDTEFAAIYEVESVPAFKDALDASPSAGHSWGVWEGRLANWSRTSTGCSMQTTRTPTRRGRASRASDSTSTGHPRKRRSSTAGTPRCHFPEVMESPGFFEAGAFDARRVSTSSGLAALPTWPTTRSRALTRSRPRETGSGHGMGSGTSTCAIGAGDTTACF